FLYIASFKSWFNSCSSGMRLVASLWHAILSSRRKEQKMKAVLLPICLMCATVSGALAQQDETTPVYDLGEAGGVIVYDGGSFAGAVPGPTGAVKQTE